MIVVVVAFATLFSNSVGAAGKDLVGVINLNTAAPEMLGLLPGVGPSKAKGIVEYRGRHHFRTVDELVRVKGIGRKMVRALRIHLAVAGPSTARAAPPGTAVALPAPPPPKVAAGRMIANATSPGRVVPGRIPTGLLSSLLSSKRTRPVRSFANHCAPPR